MFDAENKRLSFNADGKIRILMISDFHAGSRRKSFEDGNHDREMANTPVRERKVFESGGRKSDAAQTKCNGKTIFLRFIEGAMSWILSRGRWVFCRGRRPRRPV